MSDQRKHRSWLRLLGMTVLAAAGVVCMFLAGDTFALSSATLFAVGLALLVVALRPHYGIALWTAGIVTLGHGHPIDSLTGWSVAFMCLTVAGSLIGLRRTPPFATMAASVPFWVMAGAIPWMTEVAPLIFISGPVWMFWRLLISTRRPSHARGGTPLPELARGALVPVEPRTFAFSRGLVALRVVALTFALGAAIGAVFYFRGDQDLGALGVASGVVALSFWLAIWLNSRSRYRVDETGISRRVFLREVTIPWTEVTDIYIGQLALGRRASAMRYQMYGVGSPTREIAFPHTVTGAAELREIIERATGQRYDDASAARSSSA